MSQFIKSSAEISAFRTSARLAEREERHRISGFTEAERAAAEWSKGLVEAQENLSRKTNSDMRHSRRSDLGFYSSSAKKSEQRRSKSRERRPKQAGKENKQDSVELQRGSKEKKASKKDKDKDKKSKKHKKHKDDRELDKGARKLAKKMKKEEKDRKQQDRQIEAGTADVDPFSGSAAEGLSSLASAIASGADIDDLIEKARLEAGASDDRAAAVKDDLVWLAQKRKESAARSATIPASSSKAAVPQDSEILFCNSAALRTGTSTSSKDPSTDAMAVKQSEALEIMMTVPQDPSNPLNKAHDLQAYRLMCDDKSRGGRREELTRADEAPIWDHLPYLRRSPSPVRVRTRGTMWPTRRGAWKSRAGGAYLPPTDEAPRTDRRRETDDGFWSASDHSESPARYMFPEEFERSPRRESRRSPSYHPEPKRKLNSMGEPASSSSSRSRSPSLTDAAATSQLAKKKCKRKKSSSSSSSRKERPSPIYEADGGEPSASTGGSAGT